MGDKEREAIRADCYLQKSVREEGRKERCGSQRMELAAEWRENLDKFIG